MDRDALVFGTMVLGVTVGVATLLYGEFAHGLDVLVPIGGVVALIGVSGLAAGVARL
ncbi:MAG: hypothetical protein SVG88_02920 [Halobacteriales archaeon]|nr:hypothetical protein [Halobacteriales archaeon]